MKKEVPVEISIFNILGQEIGSLVPNRNIAGRVQILWDGNDKAGNPVRSGMYYLILRTGDEKISLKIIKAL